MSGGGTGGQVHMTMTSDEAEMWSAIQKIAGGFRQMETAGGSAASKTKKGFNNTSGAVNELASRLGISTRMFSSWQATGVGAAAAVGTAVYKLIKRIQEVNKEVDEMSRNAAEQTGGEGVRALADIRGTSQEAALMSTYQEAAKYDVSRETAEKAAFTIESGLKPSDVGGKENLEKIRGMALETASLTGAAGDTVGGLVMTAREAQGAQAPEDFANFMAKTREYAKQSMVTLEDFGGILNETLPEAVKRGIDPDEFMGQAAAMSFRIKDSRKVKTALRQMMRATQKGGKEMRNVARSSGQDVSQMNATQIMALQADMLNAAAEAGPQAIGEMIDKLKLPEEIASTYLSTMDQASKVRRAELMKAGRRASGNEIHRDWVAKGGALRSIRVAKIQEEGAKTLEGITEADYVASEDKAKAFVQGNMTSSGEARRARLIGITEGKARSVAIQQARVELEQIIGNEFYGEDMRSRAKKALEGISGSGMQSIHEITGMGLRPEMKEASSVIAQASKMFELWNATSQAQKEQSREMTEAARNLNRASQNIARATSGQNPDAHLEGAP